MDYTDEAALTVIDNQYDYSNIVPTVENIAYVVQYCENTFNQFKSLVEEDERKNEKLKYGVQNFLYKRTYSQRLEITIRQKNYNVISCKSLSSFTEIAKNDQISNVYSLEIQLKLDYKRGNNSKLDDYENDFKISFKPYEIKFSRKSNHNENNMNLIENNINEMLKKFPIINSIFCTK